MKGMWGVKKVFSFMFLALTISILLTACGGGGGESDGGGGNGGDGGGGGATLTSITITPANSSITIGATQQFTATGNYSDGSTQNLTTSAIWSSSDGNIATASNQVGNKGLGTGVWIGNATITATDTASNISSATTLTVGGRAKFLLDDFESGNLNNWTISGRQQGTNVAEVISRNGSKKAHLRHDDFTEIELKRAFNYKSNMTFSFEMETVAYSQASGSSDFYASAGVWFRFLDASGAMIGWVAYVKTTSTFPFNYDNGTCAINLTCKRNRISDSGAVNYYFTINDLLSQISVSGTIASVEVLFNSYASGWPYNMSADVWIDKVYIK